MINRVSSNVNSFEQKVDEFQLAMEHYHNNVCYKKTGLIVSFLILFLQAITVIDFCRGNFSIAPFLLIGSFISAYILTDFINGLMHMYMDNNTNYSSVFGPFIAAFHLHHLSPKYKMMHPLKIYFHESGTKFWLVIYLVILLLLQQSVTLPVFIHFGLVSIGILSSFAEVSHFWCHNSKSRAVLLLQKYHVLLSKQHHFIHHASDNKNYAFLNGISDPLINIIAHYLYLGYKNNADKHAKAYTGQYTKNR